MVVRNVVIKCANLFITPGTQPVSYFISAFFVS